MGWTAAETLLERDGAFARNVFAHSVVSYCNMAAAQTIQSENTVDKVFGVLAEPGTYKQVLLLFLGFPFSVFCFVSMTVLLSVGAGLSVIVVGLGILAIGLYAVRMYARLDRFLLTELAGGVFRREAAPGPGLKGVLLDPAAWKRVLYFAIRLPISIAGLSAVLLMLASILMLFAPMMYTVVPIWVGMDYVREWQEALMVSCAGAVLGLASAHLVRGVADAHRRIAEWLL